VSSETETYGSGYGSGGPDNDECQSDPCLNDALCLTENNSFKCKCTPGYTGSLCDQGSEDQYFWKMGQFGDCSKECDKGFQTRKVECSTISGTIDESQCEDQNKPITERTCNDIDCGSSIITLSLRLDLPYASAVASAETQTFFIASFTNDISISLGIPENRIRVNSITQGSVIVDFTILPGSDQPSDIVDKFNSEINSGSSWLNVNSNLISTSKTMPVVLKNEVVVSGSTNTATIVIISSSVAVVILVTVLIFVCKKKKYDTLDYNKIIDQPYIKLKF
jgi:hypothetical protein